MPDTTRAFLPWIRGWHLVPPAAAGPDTGIGLYAFRTLSATGRLGPDAEGAGWFIDLQLGAHAAEIQLSPHGLTVPGEKPGAPPYLSAFVPEPGVLVGQSDPFMRPVLGSEDLEIVKDAETEFIELHDAYVYLRVIRRGRRLHFTLVQSARNEEVVRAISRRYLDTDPIQWQAQALAPYDFFWLRHSALPPDRTRLLAYAVGNLIGDLRAAVGAIPFQWSASRNLTYPGMQTRELYPLVCAWAEVEPRVAANLVKSVLASQSEGGALPAVVRPDGLHEREFAPLPLVAQSAWRAWRVEPSRDFFDYALPRLHRYLLWAMLHFDPDMRGLPHWQDANEAVVPETFDTRLAAADLTAFLIAEIDALDEMSSSVAMGGVDMDDLLAYRQQLYDTLANTLWEESGRSFRDRFIDGAHIVRVTLSSVMPLITRGLHHDYYAPLIQALVNRQLFLTDYGLRAWVPWESDPAQPPVVAVHQLLILDGFARHSETAKADDLRRILATSMQTSLDTWRTLAAPTSESAAEEEPVVTDSPAVDSALAVCVLSRPSEGLMQAVHLSPILLWLDRHRLGVMLSLVLVAALTLGSVMISSCSKKTLTRQALETTAGMARRYYDEGDYTTALRLYQEILDSGRKVPGMYVALGNVHFRQGHYADAERCYRKELTIQTNSGPALLNLALTLYTARRPSEALAYWRQATNSLARQAPELAARAQAALELMEPPTNSRAAAVAPAVTPLAP